jgi:hypothetical protein
VPQPFYCGSRRRKRRRAAASGIRAQYEKAPNPKQLIILDGSAHAQFLFQTSQRRRTMLEILRFLSAQ